MKAFAAFILRGPLQAAAVMVAASLLPLMAVFSGGALALVTLRQGLRQGVVALGTAAAILTAALLVMAGTVEPVVRLALEQWLPVLLLAEWLRRTVSLSSTLLVWMALGAAALVGFHLWVEDPAAYWLRMVGEFMALTGSSLGSEGEIFLREEILPVMTALWAINLMLIVLGALLIGRGLQALLFNPGGLREEFHRLDLGREAAVVPLVLWLGALFSGPGLLYDLAMLAGAAFVVQALAMTHALVAARRWSAAWLVPVYLVVPFLFWPMALLGIGDALFQLRRRLIGDEPRE